MPPLLPFHGELVVVPRNDVCFSGYTCIKLQQNTIHYSAENKRYKQQLCILFKNLNSVTFTHSPPDLIMETRDVVLTFESVDEILWCDHSIETSSAVLLHGTVCFSIFYKMKCVIFLEFWS